jgi:hypothetical protein
VKDGEESEFNNILVQIRASVMIQVQLQYHTSGLSLISALHQLSLERKVPTNSKGKSKTAGSSLSFMLERASSSNEKRHQQRCTVDCVSYCVVSSSPNKAPSKLADMEPISTPAEKVLIYSTLPDRDNS